MQSYCMNCMAPIDETAGACPYCGYSGGRDPAPHQLRPGTMLSDRYLVGNALGQGGFGITYIGRDMRLDLKIAIKEYFLNGYVNRNTSVSADVTVTDRRQADFIAGGKEKFLREARILAKFNDEAGVVNVRDFFEENQTAYIIMEYLDGQDLRQRLGESLFTADEIFRLMGPIFDVLERIHKENMIHRDISPDNIMMLKNGTLKLMDFGAARQANFSDQHSVSIVFKMGFAPEEQYRSKGIQGPWTDIYALCATIYKCITGITPDDSLQRGAQDEVKWPSELGIPITPQQEFVLKKGMAVRQQDRFQSIGELKAALNGDAEPPQAVQARAGGEHTAYIFSAGGDTGKDAAQDRSRQGAAMEKTELAAEYRSQSTPETTGHGDTSTPTQQAPKKNKLPFIVGVGIVAAVLVVIAVAVLAPGRGYEPPAEPYEPSGAATQPAEPSGATGPGEAEPADESPEPSGEPGPGEAAPDSPVPGLTAEQLEEIRRELGVPEELDVSYGYYQKDDQTTSIDVFGDNVSYASAEVDTNTGEILRYRKYMPTEQIQEICRTLGVPDQMDVKFDYVEYDLDVISRLDEFGPSVFCFSVWDEDESESFATLIASAYVDSDTGTIVETLQECTPPALTEEQLEYIRTALGVPDDLDVTYTQQSPYFWEAAGVYLTNVAVYSEGKVVASAGVNSFTGELLSHIAGYGTISE